jgi:hypothetical protein
MPSPRPWNMISLCFPDSFPSFPSPVKSLPGFSPITISQLGFTPSQVTTASMSCRFPLPETESEFPSYPHHRQLGTFTQPSGILVDQSPRPLVDRPKWTTLRAT